MLTRTMHVATRLALLVLLVGATGAGLSAASTTTTGAGAQTDEAVILQRINTACEAFEKGDAAYLIDFLHETFTLTDSRGQVTTREENLAEIRKREPRYEMFRNHDMTVRVYGDSAVVTGITSIKGTSGGQSFAVEMQFTDTLVKRDGRWRMVASHASSLAKK